jgi:hypothetical protein
MPELTELPFLHIPPGFLGIRCGAGYECTRTDFVADSYGTCTLIPVAALGQVSFLPFPSHIHSRHLQSNPAYPSFS